MKFNTEIIDKYLLNQLSESEKKEFEMELSRNKSLQAELEAQRELLKGIEQLGMRTEIKTSIKKTKINKLIKNTISTAIAISLVATAIYFVTKEISTKQNTEILYELNEKGERNWTEADRVLQSQMFQINPKKDTIIETNSGIIFQIKANNFLNKFGEVPEGTIDLEVKEAMTASDIIKAGLSTTSNGELLETGGMFYINARSGKEVLDIDQSKPLKVNVPSATDKQMSLFEGQRLENADINWINPKPMKKQLATVDITNLNFYPPHFLDSLETMGFDKKNKRITDSIYYSFASQSICGELDYPVHQTIAPQGLPVLDSVSYNRNSSTEVRLAGEKLFKQNCSMCHAAHTHQKLTGPGLLGIEDRAPKGDWLIRYIMNSEKLIKSGDEYANKIYEENGKAAMTVYEGQLTEKDIQAILNYIGSVKPAKLPRSEPSCIAEINPTRIKAIWDEKFNGTILATKEFEERLQVIFGTCNQDLFNLYVQNLNSNLYELDSLAAFVYGGQSKEKFIEFYKRHDGGVDITDDQNDKLQKYLREKKSIYDEAIRIAMNKLYSDEADETYKASKNRAEYNTKLNATQANLLFEEIETNLDEAYRQLGKQRSKVQVSSSFQSAVISNSGWHNVDRYVIESTVSRSTLNYTDTTTGKVARIEYATTKVKVKGYENYDKLVCYLLTDKLSSFQFMKDSAQMFTERLNQTFANSIIVVGYKGDKTFYKDEKYVKAQEYLFNLEEIESETLVRRINARYDFTGTQNVMKDIDFNLVERKETIRMKKIESRENLRSRIFSIVYPCKKLFLQLPVTTAN
jgi:mono/diheme cytochrome c family protein